ncbi:(2Fe-2S)-binding protein [Bradyrhizobium sp. B117]|uniref:(2Fe-2S)-binding protein n=1 Tax=Bradyrhizobium sp. B117 TaxID=3140246 RepID=UPI0031844F44
MIVCSCNVFSDHQVRSVVAKEERRPRMSEVYACLGCSAQCGRCTHAIKRIMDERPGSVVRTQACTNLELIHHERACQFPFDRHCH